MLKWRVVAYFDVVVGVGYRTVPQRFRRVEVVVEVMAAAPLFASPRTSYNGRRMLLLDLV
jgi:hypothetical protein